MREVRGKIQIIYFTSLLPWATSLKRVLEIAYVGGVLDSIFGVALFLNSFLKVTENEICSKLEKVFNFHIIYTSYLINILFSSVSLGYLNLKKFKFRAMAYSETEVY